MLHFNKLNYKYSNFKTSKETHKNLEKISEKFNYYCNFFFNLNNDYNYSDNENELIINELKKILSKA